MEKHYRLETSVDGPLAELYTALLEEIEAKSAISLADFNRTLLQTGIIHHLYMLQGLGVVDSAKKQQLERLVHEVAADSMLKDVLELIRAYWQQRSDSGSIDMEA